MTANQVLRLQHDDRKGPPLVWNGAGTSPLAVCIPARVMREVIQHSQRGLPDNYPGGEQPDKSREVLGILLGASVEVGGRRLVIVQKMIPVEIRDSNQPDYCEYRAEDKARIDHTIERTGIAAYKEVGWFHTHPEHPIFLSPPDQELMRSHFAQPDQFALVVKPKEGLGGIFVWDKGRVDHTEEDLARRGGSFSLRTYYTHQDWQAMLRMGAGHLDDDTTLAEADSFWPAAAMGDAAMEEAIARESTFIPRSSPAPAPAYQSPGPTHSRAVLFLIAGLLALCAVLLVVFLFKENRKQGITDKDRKHRAKQIQKQIQARPTPRPAPRVDLPSHWRPRPLRRGASSYQNRPAARRRRWCLKVQVALQQPLSGDALRRCLDSVRSAVRQQQPKMRCYIRTKSGSTSLRCWLKSPTKVQWSKKRFRKAMLQAQTGVDYVLSSERCRKCRCR